MVLNRFADVICTDIFRADPVADGSGYFQNPVLGAGTQVVFGHRLLKQIVDRPVEVANGSVFAFMLCFRNASGFNSPHDLAL
jgi:hypothetical protein